MSRIKSLGTALLAVVLATQSGSDSVSGQTASRTGTPQRLVGTWRLISIVSADPTTRTTGANPTGLIFYDALGNMAAQIMPDRARPKWAGTLPTPDEAKAAITGYTAYWGTYTVDERAQTVTHHRKGAISPGNVGADAVRKYEFLTEDRVMLTTVPEGNRLTWERMR